MVLIKAWITSCLEGSDGKLGNEVGQDGFDVRISPQYYLFTRL